MKSMETSKENGDPVSDGPELVQTTKENKPAPASRPSTDKTTPILSSIRSFNFCVTGKRPRAVQGKERAPKPGWRSSSAPSSAGASRPSRSSRSTLAWMRAPRASPRTASYTTPCRSRRAPVQGSPNPPLRFDRPPGAAPTDLVLQLRPRGARHASGLSTHMAEAVAMSAGEAYSSVRHLVVKKSMRVGIHLRSICRIVGRFSNLESLMLNTHVEFDDMGVQKTIQQQCPKLKQLAIPCFYGTFAEPMAREYFAAMPRLVLLQGVEYDHRGGGWGLIKVARRTGQAVADSSSDARDTFRMGYVARSRALERFQCMARGDGGAVGEDRLYERLMDEAFTL
ncbi:hypothetical protein CSOJ01_08526 [Colletotrichum sojae]|uniref:F-box domain-containing protein n=1 Tax=Colletotrichum sojae TaxID=2175907 RepID=A0A8H6J5G5_9PEZI|nr:hypothetical protein CSOJ01_08526 [Colletotrichum sojae]